MGFFYFYRMNIRQYLDSTYLKTAVQAGLSEEENNAIAITFIQEAIDESFKLIMVRPALVVTAKEMIGDARSKLNIGTVIDFPEGRSPLAEKLYEAKQAIADGADDLDFVINYEAFKKGEVALVKEEVLKCTSLGIDNHKIVKWIIEVAALNSQQIVQLSTLIKNVILTNFDEDFYNKVFVKSSTGFYKTDDGLPNGATIETIIMMLENAFPLPIKAAGGVRNYDEAMAMIRLGVKRIGTSSAKAIVEGQISETDY